MENRTASFFLLFLLLLLLISILKIEINLNNDCVKLVVNILFYIDRCK